MVRIIIMKRVSNILPSFEFLLLLSIAIENNKSQQCVFNRDSDDVGKMPLFDPCSGPQHYLRNLKRIRTVNIVFDDNESAVDE